jgi:hypothetical protein
MMVYNEFKKTGKVPDKVKQALEKEEENLKKQKK